MARAQCSLRCLLPTAESRNLFTRFPFICVRHEPDGTPDRIISETARWAAVYRARESKRLDALFRDPFARRLAGERGEQIADAIQCSNKTTWSWIARTDLFYHLITARLR